MLIQLAQKSAQASSADPHVESSLRRKLAETRRNPKQLDSGDPRLNLPLALHEWIKAARLAAALEPLEGVRAAVPGARYRHDRDPLAVRDGYVPDSLVLGGRRVAIRFRCISGAKHRCF